MPPLSPTPDLGMVSENGLSTPQDLTGATESDLEAALFGSEDSDQDSDVLTAEVQTDGEQFVVLPTVDIRSDAGDTYDEPLATRLDAPSSAPLQTLATPLPGFHGSESHRHAFPTHRVNISHNRACSVVVHPLGGSSDQLMHIHHNVNCTIEVARLYL